MRFKKSYYFLAVAAVPLLLFLQNAEIQSPVHQMSQTLFKPVLLIGNTVSTTVMTVRDHIHDFWNAFKFQGGYERRIADLEGKLARYEEVVRENDRFRELLDFRKAIPGKSTAARVIGWDLSLLRKTLLLDKGTRQGLGVDNPVMVPTGLVGRIIETGPETSRVLLLLDPDSRVSALSSETRSHGIVSGDGSAELSMKYLELDSDISVGEMVMSSGIGGIFPKGLVIGKIESIERDTDGLHLQAAISPYVSFKKLEEVTCLDYSRPE